MPDRPPQQPRQANVPVPAKTAGCYAELRCRTNYSFLEGASHPDELVNRASELGLAALAITDRNSLAGVVRAHVAARETGLKLLIGAEITPIDAPPVIMLASDRNAYGHLSKLITHGRRNADKGDCRLTFQDVANHADDLLACIPLASLTSPLNNRQVTTALNRYRECFSNRCYGLAELHFGSNDNLRLDAMQRLAASASLPLAAANDVHLHDRSRQPLQDVLTAVRHGCRASDLGDRRFPNAERCLKSSDEMLKLFAAYPQAVHLTQEISDRCSFSLDELRYEYPEELCPDDRSAFEYLEELTWAGAANRFPGGPPDKVQQQLQHELGLIREMKYEAYFLTVWDLVRFARERNILCQGRGSAANSSVCFCLGVTSVDPARFETLFERFISKERNEPPDIDIDFEHERREEVLQYIYEKYGRDRAGMTGVVTTYRMKSAVRDVGKALGFSIDRVNALSQQVDHTQPKDRLNEWIQQAGLDPDSRISQQFLRLVNDIRHFPRHLSQHVGGMVFTRGLLSEMVPIENCSMPGRTVVQWDKDDLDALGILKVDCLALGMLTAIRRAIDLIHKYAEFIEPDKPHEKLTLATIPAEDPRVYEMIQAADTIGVFQIESRAQMSMLPRLKPACFYDLVIEIAIVRPGPIQGDMVHPYLRRRQGLEEVTFPDERIRHVLDRTLGVPIFQEQAMQLAVVAAGFTPGEADQLRRAMGAWRKSGVIEKFQQKFRDGMLINGYSEEFAGQVFRQIQGFGEYGFPESHSASFALLVYASAWLKRFHPAAFTAALLNSQPMGFYAPAQLIADARRHNVEVRPVDVNTSEWDCTLETSANKQPAIRLGFSSIVGFQQQQADNILRIRNLKAFVSFDDFRTRTRIDATMLSRLSRADAFQSLEVGRRKALWDSLPEQAAHPMFDDVSQPEKQIDLPTMSEYQKIIADYRATGLSLKGHPLAAFRDKLRLQKVITAKELKVHENDRKVRIAGIVLNRQHPGTAKGITFMTLEDETGTANLIIHPTTWNRFRLIGRTAAILVARGMLQREGDVIHVVVDQLKDWSPLAPEVHKQSRDFR